MKYQIVTNSARKSETLDAADIVGAFEDRGFKFIGYETGESKRKELRGQPKFEGLCGPMWNGLDTNSQPVIRYEDWASYEFLSR